MPDSELSEGKKGVTSVIVKTADALKRVIVPVSRVAGGIGAGVLVVMVIFTVAEVFARRAFNAPITGILELSSLGLVLFVFLTLAHCAAKGGHVVLDIIVTRFPKRARGVVNAIIYLLTVGMLGIASWQLWVQAARLQKASQTTGLLEIPIYPFLYIAAIGGILVTLVYLVYLLYSVEEVRK